MANPRQHNSLVADGSSSVPIGATYRLGDYRPALEHAGHIVNTSSMSGRVGA